MIGWEWISRPDLMFELQNTEDVPEVWDEEVPMACVQVLVREGLLQEESRGGRVRRLDAKGRPRQLKIQPAIEFNVDEEILHFLEAQYEPVPTSHLAYALSITIDQATLDLERLVEEERIHHLGRNEHGEDLWV
jgi:hypothetical protein